MDFKQGTSVYLTTSPDQRGSVSRVDSDGFEVVWNPFVKDRPDALALRVLGGFSRTRVRYPLDTKIVGFGVPQELWNHQSSVAMGLRSIAPTTTGLS